MILITPIASASDGACRRKCLLNKLRSRDGEKKTRSKDERRKRWKRSDVSSASSVNFKKSMRASNDRGQLQTLPLTRPQSRAQHSASVSGLRRHVAIEPPSLKSPKETQQQLTPPQVHGLLKPMSPLPPMGSCAGAVGARRV
jgi:hypothetical protein